MTKELTRREMLRLSAGTLLAVGLWPGRLRADNAAGDRDLSFVVMNDLHFNDERCAPWFDQAMTAVRASAPSAELCLACGDLSDDGTLEQLTGVREAFRRLGMRTYSVIGNHDYGSATDRRSYQETFPGQMNYIFDHAGWQFIGLDTTDGVRWKNTLISSETLSWLDENLPKLNRRRPTILFTHFPLGADVSMRPLNADDLLDRFLEFNLRAAFCGHYHGITERTFRSATITTGRCCSRVRGNHDGSKEEGWFVCHATSSGSVTRQFVEFKPSV
jgi:Calcineurin-like phosphoesterase